MAVFTGDRIILRGFFFTRNVWPFCKATKKKKKKKRKGKTKYKQCKLFIYLGLSVNNLVPPILGILCNDVGGHWKNNKQ